MRATRLVLASHLKKPGHDVDRVASAVIDYHGGSGFARDISRVAANRQDGDFQGFIGNIGSGSPLPPLPTRRKSAICPPIVRLSDARDWQQRSRCANLVLAQPQRSTAIAGMNRQANAAAVVNKGCL